jgi:hypothetical protein
MSIHDREQSDVDLSAGVNDRFQNACVREHTVDVVSAMADALTKYHPFRISDRP